MNYFDTVLTKVLEQNGLDAFSRYIAKIALPLLIFTNTINGTTKKELIG